MKLSKRVASVAIIFSIFIVAFLAVSCESQQTATIQSTHTLIPTKTKEIPLTATTSPTSTSTKIPVIFTAAATKSFFDLNYSYYGSSGQNLIETEEIPEGSEYIYKDATVSFPLGDAWMEKTYYVDLDDLSNDDPDDVDILYDYAFGNELSLQLIPVNHAIYYYSGEKAEDISSCLDHFSEMHFSKYSYEAQGWEIGSGYPFCVLTNKGHIAVVYLDNEPIFKEINGEQYNSIIVSVYKKEITIPVINTIPTKTPYMTVTRTPANVLTPLPTQEAGLYSGIGLTNDQIVNLDTAIHNFQKWVGAGKKESVATMIIYPFGYSKNGVYGVAHNKEEFLANYDHIFPEDYAQGLANVDLQEGLLVDWDRVCLRSPLDFGGVWFTLKGYIYGISD